MSWELEVQSLTNAVTLPVSTRMTCQELRQAIQEHLGIDAQRQVWHTSGKRLKFADSQSLEVLEGTSQMTVILCEPLKPLPERFELRLTSARERFKTGYSSAFVIQYRLRADAEKGLMVFEPWRKNDHDVTTYDSQEKTVKVEKSHWMAGTTVTTEDMKVDMLAELVSRWHGDYLDPGETPFWKAPSDAPVVDEKGRKFSTNSTPQTCPDYTAVPGWFVAPDEECQEIETDLEIDGKHLSRMLVKDGELLRVAMSRCRIGALHEDIEEYDVEIRELPSDQKLHSDDW